MKRTLYTAAETHTMYADLLFLTLIYSSCFINTDVILNGIVNAKSVWFIFTAGLLLLYVAVKHLIKDELLLKVNTLDLAVVALLFYMIANNAIHDEHFLSRKNIENIALIVVYFFSKTLAQPQKKTSPFYFTIIFVLVASQIAIAALQWFDYTPSFNSNFRFTGFFFNPAPFIIFLSALLVNCLAAFLFYSNKLIKYLGACLYMLAIPVVVIAFSRAAWLGLFSGSLFLLCIKFKLPKSLKNSGAVVAGVLACTLFAFFAIKYLYGLKKESADGRLLIWKLSANLIKEHPINGIGQENFPTCLLKYQSDYFLHHPEKMNTEGRLTDTVYYAFNDVLQLTSEQGLIGIALFSIMLITAAVISLKTINGSQGAADKGHYVLATGAEASLVVILVSGLTSYPLSILPILVLFYVSLGLLSGCGTAVTHYQNKPARVSNNVLIIALTVMGVGFLISGFVLGKAYYLENKVVNDGYTNEKFEQINKVSLLVASEPWYKMRQIDHLLRIGQYKKAIVKLEEAKQNISNKALYFSLADLYNYEKKYQQAEAQLLFMYYALPALVEPKYRLALFYYHTGQMPKWNALAGVLLNFQPKVPSSAANMMVAEIRELYQQ